MPQIRVKELQAFLQADLNRAHSAPYWIQCPLLGSSVLEHAEHVRVVVGPQTNAGAREPNPPRRGMGELTEIRSSRASTTHDGWPHGLGRPLGRHVLVVAAVADRP